MTTIDEEHPGMLKAGEPVSITIQESDLKKLVEALAEMSLQCQRLIHQVTRMAEQYRDEKARVERGLVPKITRNLGA